MFTEAYIIDFLYSCIRLATPLIYCTLGALVSMHAGQINMAMEGILLTSGLTGVLISGFTGNLFLGALGAFAGGIIISLVMGFMNIVIDANMMLCGISMNNFASGGTIMLLFAVLNTKGSSASLKSLTFPEWDIPLLKDIPFAGPVLSGHNVLTYMAFVMAVITYFFIFRTRTGLRIRAIGMNPNAAASVGINVKKIRFQAYIYSGIFAALGGAFMTMGYLSYWAQNMMGGRGFIGISAANLSGGNVLLGTVTAVLFGATSALSIVLQTLNLKPELMQMLPYIATIIGLVVISIVQKRRDEAIIRKAAMHVRAEREADEAVEAGSLPPVDAGSNHS